MLSSVRTDGRIRRETAIFRPHCFQWFSVVVSIFTTISVQYDCRGTCAVVASVAKVSNLSTV